MMRYLFVALSGLVLFLSPQQGRAEDVKLAVIVFPGVQNLPMFAAQAKGQRSSCTRRIPGNERVCAASMGQGECRFIGQISRGIHGGIALEL